jgi:hypothetical protein
MRMYAEHGSIGGRVIPSQAASNSPCGNPAIVSSDKCKCPGGAMNNQAEGDEEILAFDIPDEALERAASTERQAFTWVYCTSYPNWYDCSWPQ